MRFGVARGRLPSVLTRSAFRYSSSTEEELSGLKNFTLALVIASSPHVVLHLTFYICLISLLLLHQFHISKILQSQTQPC